MAPLLGLLLLAAAAPGAGCPPPAPALLDELNALRAAAGAAPLRPDEALCRTAAERAGEIEENGGTAQDESAIHRRTTALYRRGYAAYAWSEAAILGGGDEPVLEQFRQVRPGWHGEALSGDFEDFGAAVGRLRSRPVYVILLALPQATVDRRQAAPLADLPAVRATVLVAVNAARAEHGLRSVEADGRLAAAAQAHAEDMLRNGYYDHRSLDGTGAGERVRAAGYPARRAVAENIAKGLFTPIEVVERWLASPGHRRNILRPAAASLGVGVAVGETAEGLEVLWDQLLAD
jgi:uncharacterized protein YkwD